MARFILSLTAFVAPSPRGYKSVPAYPASHGCLRNPIPNSLFIYNWIDIGDDIYVYP